MEERNDTRHEYELMGKKFYVSDLTIDNIEKIADLCDAGWFTLFIPVQMNITIASAAHFECDAILTDY